MIEMSYILIKEVVSQLYAFFKPQWIIHPKLFSVLCVNYTSVSWVKKKSLGRRHYINICKEQMQRNSWDFPFKSWEKIQIKFKLLHLKPQWCHLFSRKRYRKYWNETVIQCHFQATIPNGYLIYSLNCSRYHYSQ